MPAASIRSNSRIVKSFFVTFSVIMRKSYSPRSHASSSVAVQLRNLSPRSQNVEDRGRAVRKSVELATKSPLNPRHFKEGDSLFFQGGRPVEDYRDRVRGVSGDVGVDEETSRARYTSPIPPFPSRAMISCEPSLVPTVMAMKVARDYSREMGAAPSQKHYAQCAGWSSD